MEPTIDHDDDAPDETPAPLGIGHDPEPTTGAPPLAPDAPTTSGAASTKKRVVNDGPTGRARREEANREGELEGNLEPSDLEE